MRTVSSFLPLVALVASASLASGQKANSGEMVKLTFPNADVRDVLAQYEILVGKHLIYDNQVQGQVNINVPEVPKEEAIKIIEVTLIMNGYHIVPVDSDPNLLKVTGLARSPRQVAIPLIADPEPLPDGEQVVMYLVKLQYADPTELATTLSQAIPASRSEYAPNIVPLPKAQALLITENTAIIRILQRIIRATDTEPTRVEGEFITMQRASAKDVVAMLEKMFEKPNQNGAPGGGAVPRPATPAPTGTPGAAPTPTPTATSTTIEIGGMTEDSLVAGKVRLTADERTNRIYVVSRPVNLPLIRKLIQEFDEDVRFNEPVVRMLKYVSSGDVLDALVKAISDPGTKDNGASGSTTGQKPNGNTTPAIQPQTSSSFGSQSGIGGRSGGSSLASNVGLQTTERSSTPTTVMVGNARLMADNRRNAIIVIGSSDVKDKVFKLLDQLDVRAPQVMLSTVIGELTLDKNQSLGLTYLLNNGQRSALTAPVTTTSTTGTTTTTTPTGGIINVGSGPSTSLNLQNLLSDTRFSRVLSAGAGGIGGFVAVGDSFNAIVTALESTNRFKVTSRPSVFATNNKKAVITSGEEIAVATSVQSGLSTAATPSLVSNSSVQYKPIELRLEVVPLINSDKEVYLDIFQQVQDKSGTSKIDNNDYPTLSNRAISTSLTVPNEGTLALGGLIKMEKKKDLAGIPVLGSIPLIGPLFRSTSVGDKRSELVILIRPSVSMNAGEDEGVRDKNLRSMQLPSNLEDTLGLEKPMKVSDPIHFRGGRVPPVEVPPAAEVVPAKKTKKSGSASE